MHQMLRGWIVELASWNHIAARKWESPLMDRFNKPLFVITRLICFPYTYLLYYRERSSLSAADIITQVPALLQPGRPD